MMKAKHWFLSHVRLQSSNVGMFKVNSGKCIYLSSGDNAHIIDIFCEALRSSDSLCLQGRWTLEGIVISITAAANVVGACAKGTHNVISNEPDDRKQRNDYPGPTRKYYDFRLPHI